MHRKPPFGLRAQNSVPAPSAKEAAKSSQSEEGEEGAAPDLKSFQGPAKRGPDLPAASGRGKFKAGGSLGSGCMHANIGAS